MKLDGAFENVHLIGLDTSPFIYFVERNSLYVDIMREIFKRLTDGEFLACSSVKTLTEVLVQPFRQNNRILADTYRNLIYKGINLKLLPIKSSTAETATKLRAKYNLRILGALQIATALENGCEAFLCNDKNLKKVAEIKVLIHDEIKL
jgi:predicted nucleic acid-binding protein